MRITRIWNGVAKQLQEIARDLAFACNVHPLNVSIRTDWCGWTMVWVAVITTDGGNTYTGRATTPVEACRKARNVFTSMTKTP